MVYMGLAEILADAFPGARRQVSHPQSVKPQESLPTDVVQKPIGVASRPQLSHYQVTPRDAEILLSVAGEIARDKVSPHGITVYDVHIESKSITVNKLTPNND
ncbi:hypothetical protein A2115_02150 [Candidatus Woesebacteria bacterium GWA1_41_8]|jgi:hypothetical protein|uniref:Uncharacterized protein n=1 Tax=Candidatus Woesebacteria bacterium GWA1_41_8 TaxID=1802471 RepID=A0A1F7WL51_9BACT|nr:MAG: hypothetical protein A2115_02150 [Candidatus Woesebacteria bacterium GWA1_41_8]